MTNRILVVDDDSFMLTSLEDILSGADFECVTCSSAEQGLEALRQQPFDVVITDLKMPGMGGLDFLERALQVDPNLPILLITAHGTVETAVQAMQRGALDYILKPFGAEALLLVVRRALERRRLLDENAAFRGEQERSSSDRPLLGESRGIDEVRQRIAAVAKVDTTVLIRGETGTGKELVARAIHYASDRRDRPYLCVNCAALSAGLLESELFGHEKGAFTGADRQRLGRFELANGGTLLLDEVSEIDLNLQAKLLRVLQEREFERVGSEKTQKSDVRVLATTNRDLQTEVEEGRFRADLFYRLNIVPIHVPPLRERRDDILRLAEVFRERFERRAGRDSRPFSEKSKQAMTTYHWPGNVRELENVVERAVLLSAGPEVEVDGLAGPTQVGEQAPSRESLRGMRLAEVERVLIEDTLRRYDGHQERTAATLGIGVRTLRDKIKKWDLRFGRRAAMSRARG